MTKDTNSKLNKLLKMWPQNMVSTASWLKKNGYGYDLLYHYKSSDWLRSVGDGAYYRSDGKPTIEGAISALVNQLGLKVHVGSRSALEYLGVSHYGRFGIPTMFLFGEPLVQLPKWFVKFDWGVKVDYSTTNLFGKKPQLGIESIQRGDISFPCSSRERAIFEFLYHVNKKTSLGEGRQLMGSLNNLRPTLVEELLRNCKSIRVRRLILFLADKAGHQWFSQVNLKRISLGSGKRQIEKNGVLDKKYLITVPRNIDEP